MRTKKTKRQPRSQRPNKPILIAHRGGNGAGPEKENTLVAFESATKLGYKYLETDAVLSRDGQVVAYHGSRNLFWAFKTGLVLRRKLEKLTYGQIKDNVSAGGETLPLMSEVVSQFYDCQIKIDAKTDKVYKPLINLIADLDAFDRVCIATFNPFRMNKISKELEANGQDCLKELIISPTMMLLLRVTGLIGWYISRAKVDILGLPYRQINQDILNLTHSRDKKVYAWTVNDPREMKRMAAMGVDGIISDETRLLKTTISTL